MTVQRLTRQDVSTSHWPLACTHPVGQGSVPYVHRIELAQSNHYTWSCQCVINCTRPQRRHRMKLMFPISATTGLVHAKLHASTSYCRISAGSASYQSNTPPPKVGGLQIDHVNSDFKKHQLQWLHSQRRANASCVVFRKVTFSSVMFGLRKVDWLCK